MPVTKCESNGKWKIGNGPCIYQTREKAVEVWTAILASGKYAADSNKVSYDYDDTLTKKEYQYKAKQDIADGKIVYIISARHEVSGMKALAEELGIPMSRVYATGSNGEKIKKVKELNIGKHYDNNQDVIRKISELNA